MAELRGQEVPYSNNTSDWSLITYNLGSKNNYSCRRQEHPHHHPFRPPLDMSRKDVFNYVLLFFLLSLSAGLFSIILQIMDLLKRAKHASMQNFGAISAVVSDFSCRTRFVDELIFFILDSHVRDFTEANKM